MFVTLLSIYNPTITKAGAVAKDGIARKIGDKNRDNPKRIAVVTAVRPVLPPSDTPEALSTKVVVVEVPRIAPKVVATASARSAPLIWGSFPSSSNISALADTPTSVPIVSKRSTNKNANKIDKNIKKEYLKIIEKYLINRKKQNFIKKIKY